MGHIGLFKWSSTSRKYSKSHVIFIFLIFLWTIFFFLRVVSNSHIFASGTIRLKTSNNNLNTPRSRKKSASETTFGDKPSLPGYVVIPVHRDSRDDRRKSSTVDTGRSVSVKNFEGRTRVGSYYQQHLLPIPVQTPTHNAPIISTWGEADKLDNISSLEDGLNRVNQLFCSSQ